MLPQQQPMGEGTGRQGLGLAVLGSEGQHWGNAASRAERHWRQDGLGQQSQGQSLARVRGHEPHHQGTTAKAEARTYQGHPRTQPPATAVLTQQLQTIVCQVTHHTLGSGPSSEDLSPGTRQQPLLHPMNRPD